MKRNYQRKKRKTEHRKVKGYMTLEAAFIMPWVIFIFIFLIYIGFYLYDKCVLFQDVYTICFRGSIQKEEDAVSDYIDSHMEAQFGRKYFGVGKVEGNVRQSGQEVRVCGVCSVKVPFGYFLTMAKEGGWQIQTEARAQIINPTQIIRRRRMAENALHYLQE